jgi:hypothetical protein
VFVGGPVSKGPTQRVVIAKKTKRPLTLNERFTVLQQLREEAAKQRRNSLENALDRKRGLNFLPKKVSSSLSPEISALTD